MKQKKERKKEQDISNIIELQVNTKTCSYYIIKIVKREKRMQSTRKSPDDVDRKKNFLLSNK